ncbi:alkaline phosphatase family protein [Desulfogranum japonicum]|uniref:alkaline phosphatase family protein n=1 Tax=Desulfogranum japonicum TaxID=231447 RepID=UPI0003F88E95|nr:alkaline phosphatase [Desulfogranum japonicum]
MTKVVCVVIDGLRQEALQCAHAHCLDNMISKGTYANTLYHYGPDLTLPAFATLFTSMPVSEHGILTNSSAVGLSPHTSSITSLSRYHNKTTSIFFSKEQIRSLFPQDSLHTSLFINSGGIKNVDNQLADQAARHIQKEKPDVCWLYLQGTDIAGTHFGYLSEPYLESVERADQSIGLLMEQMAVVGLQNEYVLMVLASHSGSWNHQSTFMPSNEPLPWIVCGPGIAEGCCIERKLSLMDLTPTLAQILGFESHPCWQGRIVQELFSSQDEEVNRQEKRGHVHLFTQRKIPTAA